MKKLRLTECELKILDKIGVLFIDRGGISICIEYTNKYSDTNYEITIINPYDNYSIDKQIKLMKGEK